LKSMKKLSYLLGLLLIAGMIFSSCKKDEDDNDPIDLTPTINLKGDAGYTSGDVTINEGDTILVGIIALSNTNSGKKLTNFKLTLTSNNVPQVLIDSTLNGTTFDVNYKIGFPDASVVRLSAKITDKDGQSKEISFNITIEEVATPLDAAADFTWQRIGANPGTGLDMFGLKWTWNGKAVNAKIEKDGADKLVQLSSAEWNSIETKEDLAAAVEAAADISIYEGVSAEASATYDDVLATKYNGEYFIIHVENATVETGTGGTTITITGEYKK
ncbi:MAG: hypothetical protein K8R58_05185, partial [Bacteroidales bacterium]|nr:hypothetical protein [Bacteroidales bacterium]